MHPRHRQTRPRRAGAGSRRGLEACRRNLPASAVHDLAAELPPRARRERARRRAPWFDGDLHGDDSGSGDSARSAAARPSHPSWSRRSSGTRPRDRQRLVFGSKYRLSKVAIAWPGVGPGHVTACFMCLSSRVWPSISSTARCAAASRLRTSRRTGHRASSRPAGRTCPGSAAPAWNWSSNPSGSFTEPGRQLHAGPRRIDLFFEMLGEELVEEPVVAKDETEVRELDVGRRARKRIPVRDQAVAGRHDLLAVQRLDDSRRARDHRAFGCVGDLRHDSADGGRQ